MLKIFKNKKGNISECNNRISRPYRDWKMILSVFFIFFIGCISYGVILFRGISKGTLFEAEKDTGKNQALSLKGDLSDTVDRFDRKTNEYKTLSNEYKQNLKNAPRPKDPTLVPVRATKPTSGSGGSSGKTPAKPGTPTIITPPVQEPLLNIIDENQF